MTLPQEKYWTYEDYCELPEDGKRYEGHRRGTLFNLAEIFAPLT